MRLKWCAWRNASTCERGIIREENLAMLRKHDGHYLAVTPRSKLNNRIYDAFATNLG